MDNLDEDMQSFFQRSIASRPKYVKPTFEPITESRQLKVSDRPEEKPREPADLVVPKVLTPPPPTVTSVTPNYGMQAGGKAVTITGTGFIVGTPATVTFAGTAATSVVVVNTTTITCVTPAHTVPTGNTQLVDVVVTQVVPGTLTNGFKYQKPVYAYYDFDTFGHSYAGSGTTYFRAASGVDGSGNYIPYTDYDGSVNVSTSSPYNVTSQTAGPNPANVSSGVATVNFSGTASSSGGNFLITATDVDTPSVHDTVLVQLDAGSGGGGGGVDHFVWTDTSYPSSDNPFSWISGHTHTIEVKRILASGVVDTSYNGTATISHSITSPSSYVTFSIGNPGTLTFSSGVASFSCRVDFIDSGPGYQAYGYFTMSAVDGTTSGNTPSCVVLNHL